MPESNPGSQDERNQSYWFHILAQNPPAARNLHAAKLVDKAWQQGDRVCVVCDTMQHAEELDDLLWNFAPEVTKDWKFPEKIQIHDVTLRDGEQQAGVAFDYDDKIRIAEGLAEIGVHRIEAGMPVVSRDDARVVQDLQHPARARQFVRAGRQAFAEHIKLPLPLFGPVFLADDLAH